MPIYALGTERPRIHRTAFVHPEAVLIGEVHLGPQASVWPGAVIRADNGPIHIGGGTSVQDGAVIHTQPVHRTMVGRDCVIAHLAHLEGCLLEDDVLVGSGAIVLERAVCRRISFVAAGAVVTPGVEVPSGAMALGVPARIRPGVVDLDLVHGNVLAYIRHLAQHRDTMQRLDLADCLTDTAVS